MNPAKVDVNVHPAKLEVRFQEENKVFQAVYHAIKDTLLKEELVANTEKSSDSNEQNTTVRNALSFEERLKNLRESKKENQTGGLFSFRKQNEKQIEEYTEEESKIKTNAIEDIYKNRNAKENQLGDVATKTETKNENEISYAGNPIDTSDVLAKLREMKEKLESELQEKKNSQNTLSDISEKYELETEKNSENKIENENPNNEEKEDSLEEKTEKQEETKLNTEETQKIEKISETIEQIDNKEIKEEFNQIKEKMEKLDDNTQVVSEDFNEMYTKLFGRKPIEEEQKEDVEKEKLSAVDIVKDNISMFETEEQFKKPVYKFIGIVFNTYIILEIGKEMYILDQHAAHERIMYEKVKKNYYSDTAKDSQMLLLPDVITLTHKEMDIAKENMKMFEQAGFSLEEFGENTIKLTGVPTVCIDLDTKELFLETLDEINTVARTAKQEKEEKFIATVACKAAVKANMALDRKEVESLMDKLLSLPNPFTCPHGRPTAIKMTKYDIERKFARK